MITILDILKRSTPFSSLSDFSLEELSKKVKKLRYRNKEQFLLNKGTLYLIMAGRVSETVISKHQEKFYLAHFEQGDTLGLFDSENVFQCRQPTELFEIYDPTLRRQFKDHRIEMLQSQLDQSKAKLFDLAFLNVEERVLKGYKRGEFDKCSKQEVAYHVGASREMVSRITTKFDLKVGHGKSPDLTDQEISRLPC